jgi:hypothetical protein
MRAEGMREGIRKDRLTHLDIAEKGRFATGFMILLVGYGMQRRRQRLREDRVQDRRGQRSGKRRLSRFFLRRAPGPPPIGSTVWTDTGSVGVPCVAFEDGRSPSSREPVGEDHGQPMVLTHLQLGSYVFGNNAADGLADCDGGPIGRAVPVTGR